MDHTRGHGPQRTATTGVGTGSPLRLADLLASLSLVADLGFGLPPESAMRSCLIATALARRLGLAEPEVATVYYTALLEHVGCTGYAHEGAARYGDELLLNAAAARTDFADPRDLFTVFLPHVSRGRPLAWVRFAILELTSGSRFGRQITTAACEVGRATARRLGLPADVQRGLHEVYEWWNGDGGAQGLKGEAISPAGRIAALAATAAHFHSFGEPGLAVHAVTKQAGGVLDPELARAFAAHSDQLLQAADAEDPFIAVLEAEPRPVRTVPAPRLADIAAAFADVVDLKSPWFHGHSSAVASLAADAGERLGLDPVGVERLSVAGFLHDVGRVGVSDGTWGRPGRLTTAQWEAVRMHAYHSERILVRSATLRPMGELAGMHHERLDGSGYHRATTARGIPLEARVLAAADAFNAMTQARPHRAARSADEAAARLHDDARAGRYDADATDAVLDVVGLPRPRIRAPAPAGLSQREIEVLRAVSQGLSNQEIARLFTISPRTAEHHVQHIYTKIGVSSRAAAALFAMEHDLLG